MIPIVLQSNGRLAVVVGCGAVGRRKAATCAAGGLPVRVVDPVAEPFPGVEWVAETYRADHLLGAGLVVAAATPEVNRAVVADARRLSVLVCDAADPANGDFVFPAVVRRGGLTLAVSTGGASPALSGRLRDRLDAEFGPEYAAWVELLAEVRRLVLESVPDAATRRRLLAGFADDRWRLRVRDAGVAVARAEMLAVMSADGGVGREKP